jgi:Family of unknown function (DUF6492)
LKDMVLYCKTYRNDFLRVKRLLRSIDQYNVDQIPFFISTPRADRPLLEEVLGKEGYQWVSDEEIVQANARADFQKYLLMPGGLSQQIVKAEFWRLNIAQNYLCLDSDSIFIKNFTKANFLNEEGIPYTVLHQNKELFQLATDRGHLKVERELKAEALRVKAVFNRVGPEFYCAPSPFMWSAKVWQSLDREYLIPHQMSIWDFIDAQHPESLIYGEALIKYRAISLIAIEPLFRAYHYDWQYFLMRRLGENEEKLKQNYLGVIYQSAWESEFNFGQSQKNFLSRTLKRVKRYLRQLQSFI